MISLALQAPNSTDPNAVRFRDLRRPGEDINFTVIDKGNPTATITADSTFGHIGSYSTSTVSVTWNGQTYTGALRVTGTSVTSIVSPASINTQTFRFNSSAAATPSEVIRIKYHRLSADTDDWTTFGIFDYKNGGSDVQPSVHDQGVAMQLEYSFFYSNLFRNVLDQIHTSNGDKVQISLASGSLPDGLSVPTPDWQSSYVLYATFTGTPTESGTFNFSLRYDHNVYEIGTSEGVIVQDYVWSTTVAYSMTINSVGPNTVSIVTPTDNYNGASPINLLASIG